MKKNPNDILLPNPDDCIRCLLCFSVCPVIHETLGKAFISPNYFTSDVMRNQIIEIDEISDVIYNCLNCGACTIACPRNIDTTVAIHFLRNLYVRYILRKTAWRKKTYHSLTIP